MRLLLVEDEPTQLLMTQRMLRRGGFEVETASDGATAQHQVVVRRVDNRVDALLHEVADDYHNARSMNSLTSSRRFSSS